MPLYAAMPGGFGPDQLIIDEDILGQNGFLITFEGGEGTGKSTQIRLLQSFLTDEGYDVVITREPGGTSGAEQIRALLLQEEAPAWDDLEECLLMNAARARHIRAVIKPALAAGKIVLCDRYIHSTRAYQAGAGGMTLQDVQAIERIVAGSALPDLTLILDLDPKTGLRRAASRGEADRFERKGFAYHEKVRQTFLAIAHADPDRCKIIAADTRIETISRQVNNHVMACLTQGR